LRKNFKERKERRSHPEGIRNPSPGGLMLLFSLFERGKEFKQTCILEDWEGRFGSL